jgi:hypothetical protein
MTRCFALIAALAFSLIGAEMAGAQNLPGGMKLPTFGGKKTPDGVKLPAGLAPNCGNIESTSAGVKVKAFLEASAEVDRGTAALEASVQDACRDMAAKLQISTEGKTKVLCSRVAAEIKSSLRVGVKSRTAVTTKYTPAVCKVDADFTANVAAKCEGRARADVKVTCNGTCNGNCNGACAGTCAAKNTQGQCDGECKGTCRGNCSGSCSGSADVDGSAECKASAQARGNLKAECTEPKVEVTVDSKTVVDTARIERAQAALKSGLPALLAANAKAKLVAKSVTAWARTAGKMGTSGGVLVRQMGAQAMCVAGEMAGAARMASQVNVRVSVSVQASASVSGAAGARAS